MLYRSAMQTLSAGQQWRQNDGHGEKVLALDPDDPEALVGVSQVLAERTRDTDLDRDQQLAEAKKDAERALVTVDTDVPTSGYPPEQIDSL